MIAIDGKTVRRSYDEGKNLGNKSIMTSRCFRNIYLQTNSDNVLTARSFANRNCYQIDPN